MGAAPRKKQSTYSVLDVDSHGGSGNGNHLAAADQSTIPSASWQRTLGATLSLLRFLSGDCRGQASTPLMIHVPLVCTVKPGMARQVVKHLESHHWAHRECETSLHQSLYQAQQPENGSKQNCPDTQPLANRDPPKKCEQRRFKWCRRDGCHRSRSLGPCCGGTCNAVGVAAKWGCATIAGHVGCTIIVAFGEKNERWCRTSWWE